MREQLRERVMQVYEITCLEQGNAFLTENNLLITVKHVVAANRLEPESEKPKYPIMLDPGNGEVKIKCEILTQDADNFEDSTLVLLKPEKELTYTCKACDSFLTARGMEVNGYINSIRMSLGIDTSDSKKTEITAYLPHKEATNAQIALKNPLKSFKGLSGSPVVIADTVYGVMIDEIVDGAGCASRAHILCDDEYWRRRDILVNNLSKQEEAMKKAEKPVPSFAEYVADVCRDCPPKLLSLLHDSSEYTNQYPGKNISVCKSKLQDIIESMLWVDTSNDASNASIEAEIEAVYKKLEDIYSEPTRRLNVYISALSVCVNKAHKERKSNPQGMENIIRLLDHAHTVAGLVDFPYRHLFLAECYIGINKKAEAMKELNIAIKKAGRNTNLLADIYSQIVCCVKGIENSKVLAKLENAKGARPEKSQCCSTYTECLRLLSYYKAENAKAENAEFVDAELVSAVQNIVEAYDLDSREKGMEEYREEDHKCFRYICNMALNYYTNMGFEGYGDWQAFYRFASGSDMYNKIADTFKGTVWNKWIAAMGQCRYIQTQLEEVVKEKEIEELEYRSVDESGTNIKKVISGLEYCANKQLIVIEWDIAAGYYDALQEEVEKFRALLRNELSSASEREYPVEKEDAHLYKYECKIDDYGENRPPVWVLICRK